MTARPVLIVGDDDLIAWAIRKRCSALRVPVQVVATPGEALAKLRAGRFGLVVIDPEFLKGDGAALLEALRDGAVDGDRSDGASGAALRFVEKPLSIGDLERVVMGMIGGGGAGNGETSG